MWRNSKKLLAAGALWVVAGTRSFTQVPGTVPHNGPPVLPAPSVQPGTGWETAASNQGLHGEPVIAQPDARACGSNLGYAAGDYEPVKRYPCLAYVDHGAAPLGYLMHQAFQANVDNGVSARMVLHDYDFICGAEKLNLAGSDHLLHIAQFWRTANHVLIIERTPRAPALAEKRRSAVLSYLAARGIIVPPELVVIGPSPSIPLRGFEAELIFNNLVQQTQSRGYIPPLYGGSGAGLLQSGSGFGLGLGGGLGSIGAGGVPTGVGR